MNLYESILCSRQAVFNLPLMGFKTRNWSYVKQEGRGERMIPF